MIKKQKEKAAGIKMILQKFDGSFMNGSFVFVVNKTICLPVQFFFPSFSFFHVLVIRSSTGFFFNFFRSRCGAPINEPRSFAIFYLLYIPLWTCGCVALPDHLSSTYLEFSCTVACSTSNYQCVVPS